MCKDLCGDLSFACSDDHPSGKVNGRYTKQAAKRMLFASAVLAGLGGLVQVAPATAIEPDFGDDSLDSDRQSVSDGDSSSATADASSTSYSGPSASTHYSSDSDNDRSPGSLRTSTKATPAPSTSTPAESVPLDEQFYDEVGIDVPFQGFGPTPAEEDPGFFDSIATAWSSLFGSDPANESVDSAVIDEPDSSTDDNGIQKYSGDVIVGTDGDDLIAIFDGSRQRLLLIKNDQARDIYSIDREPGKGVTIDGRAGDDVINGSDFADHLIGGPGNDVILGRAFYIAGTTPDDGFVEPNTADRIEGGPGDDYLYGLGGDDVLSGGPGNDVLYGGKGQDQLFGGSGDDYISGGGGNDTIQGGSGDDIISGGVGADSLDGGADSDVVITGPGSDLVEGTNDGAPNLLYVSDGDEFAESGQDEIVRLEPVILANVSLDVETDASADFLVSDMVTLGSISSGAELITSINDSGHPVILANREVFGAVPQVYWLGPPELGVKNPDGSANPGTPSTVVSPFQQGGNDDVPLSVVALGHELVHVDHRAHGITDPGWSVELDADGEALLDPTSGSVVFSRDSELQATGLPYDVDGNQSGFPWDLNDRSASSPEELDNNPMAITENSIRSDLRLPPRTNYQIELPPVDFAGDGESTGRYSAPIADDGQADIIDFGQNARVTLYVGSDDDAESNAASDRAQESPAGPTTLVSESADSELAPEPAAQSPSNPALAATGPCEDTDGDGWGWDGHKSCRMLGTPERHPICANGSASDSDGDGFGWEQKATCRVAS